jgi:hypothetical protein
MKKATIADKPIIVDILLKAFDLNGSVNYVIKQDKKRAKRIKKLMEYSFELCFRFGDVMLTEDKLGVALLLFPKEKSTSLKNILLDLKLAIQVIGLNRIFKILERESKIKKNHPYDMIYLWFIGVQPKMQGNGLGSLLLKEIIKKSNAKNQPIYLETSMEQNLPFYKRAGFEIYNTIDFDYKLYLLKKEPE